MLGLILLSLFCDAKKSAGSIFCSGLYYIAWGNGISKTGICIYPDNDGPILLPVFVAANFYYNIYFITASEL
jgi:hypothetical protein